MNKRLAILLAAFVGWLLPWLPTLRCTAYG